MDDQELALSFAAEKETEELRERVNQLENLREEHEKQIGDLYVNNRRMQVFIKGLFDFPYFWARSYKREISRYYNEHLR